MSLTTDDNISPVTSHQSFIKLLMLAFQDLYGGLKKWRLWTALAWEDVKTTYRRSIIGVLWITLSFAIFVGVKVIIFGSFILGREIEYFGAYLTLGFLSFQFMNQVVSTAPNVFISSESWIRNDPIELSVFVYQAVLRSLFDFAFTGLAAISFFFYFGQSVSHTALILIPAIIIYILNAIWVKLLLGVICTRYRDVTHLVTTVMRVMFFISPIFWLPEQLGEAIMKYLWWNPFAHFIWILRTPLLDHTLALDSWIYVGTFTLTGWLVAIFVFSIFRHRIVFWF